MDETHTIVFDARMTGQPFSGVQRYAHSLIRAMAPMLADDEHLHVILPPGPSEWVPASPRVFVHSVSAPAPSFKSHWEAYGVERSLKPQVTHSPSAFTPVHIPGRLVLTIHDLIPVSNPRFKSRWFRTLWWFSAFRAIRHARKLIAVSEASLKIGAKLLGKRAQRRGTVIPLGVDAAFRPQSPERIAAIRRTYNLPAKFLLYIGSDAPHKNLTTLLQAFASQDPTACCPLVAAGFDSADSPARQEAEELGIADRVIWLGPVPETDLPALYSAAHAFCFPSLVEGFCFPVLEAMACGTPVICSALSVLTDLTAGAANAVHPTDKQEWSRAIHAAVVSLTWRDTYRAKGLERVAFFSWERAAKETLAIYRQLYPKRAHGEGKNNHEQ